VSRVWHDDTVIIEVPDLDAQDLSAYARLTDVALRTREEPARGLYIAESAAVIERAVGAGHQPISFLMAPKWLASMRPVIAAATGAPDGGRVPVYLAEEGLLRDLTGYRVHRGALAAMHRPILPAVADVLTGARRVVVFEDVVDHTNLGAGFRSAAALGADAVLVTPRCADPLYRRSVRVSMGTVFQVPWTRIDPWPGGGGDRGRRGGGGNGGGGNDDACSNDGEGQAQGVHLLRARGFTVAALALADDAIDLDDLEADPPEKLALVLGTEGDGLRPETTAACDLSVRIPMGAGVDSLNVAAAVSVALWATRVR